MHQGNTIKKSDKRLPFSKTAKKNDMLNIICTKGQELSEGIFGFFNSPKNRTNTVPNESYHF